MKLNFFVYFSSLFSSNLDRRFFKELDEAPSTSVVGIRTATWRHFLFFIPFFGDHEGGKVRKGKTAISRFVKGAATESVSVLVANRWLDRSVGANEVR